MSHSKSSSKNLSEGMGEDLKTWIKDLVSGGPSAKKAQSDAEAKGVDINDFVEKIKKDESNEDESATDILDYMNNMDSKDLQKKLDDYRRAGANPKVGQTAPERVVTPPKKSAGTSTMYKLPENLEQTNALIEAISRKGLSPEELEELEAYETGYIGKHELSAIVKNRVNDELTSSAAMPTRSDQWEDPQDRRIKKSTEKFHAAQGQKMPRVGMLKKGQVDQNKCEGFGKPEFKGQVMGQVAGACQKRVWLGKYRPSVDPFGNKVFSKVYTVIDWHAWEWDGQKWNPNPFYTEEFQAKHWQGKTKDKIREMIMKKMGIVSEGTWFEEQKAQIEMSKLERGPIKLSLMALYEDPTYDSVASIVNEIPEQSEDDVKAAKKSKKKSKK